MAALNRLPQSGLHFRLQRAIARQIIDAALRNGISDEDFRRAMCGRFNIHTMQEEHGLPVYAPSGHVVRCSYHIVAAGSKPAGHAGLKARAPRSALITVDDQTRWYRAVALRDIRDHVATQQTSEGSAV